MTIPLILASASPRRRQLLARLGLPYTVAVAPVNEDAIQQCYTGPSEGLAQWLAEQKAISALTLPEAEHAPLLICIMLNRSYAVPAAPRRYSCVPTVRKRSLPTLLPVIHWTKPGPTEFNIQTFNRPLVSTAATSTLSAYHSVYWFAC